MHPKWKTRLGGALALALGVFALKKTGAAAKAASFAAGALETAMAYVAGRAVGAIQLTSVDGKKVELQTAKQFLAMRAAAARDGVALQLSSGFRTMPEQRVLYARYLGKKRDEGTFQRLLASSPSSEHAALRAGYKAADGNLAAVPGTSNHQNGVAIDIVVRESFTSPEYLWLEKNAARYGFVNTGKSFKGQPEPWHWERKRVV